jgi:2-methylcitrate dehydratase
MALMSTLAERMTDYALGLRFEDLPGPVVHEVKRRLMDSLACALGALDEPAPRIARRVAGRVRCEPSVRLIAGGGSSPELAAFANGVLVRYLDFNDTYLSLEPAHPSDNLPAVLAVAEAAGRSGRDAIVAAVLAYELQCRLCDAASIRARGWDHVTYGSFSTALAAAKLLGCDARATVHALGLAGVDGVALRQTRAGELSMWKGCAFANAARNGVFAALLAADGMSGPAPIFEGVFGFHKLVSGPFDVPAWGGGAEPFMITKTHIKFWPAEYHAQSAIEAALELRAQIPATEAIEAIDIDSFDAAVDIIGSEPEKWRPQTRETADHSLPYCVAVALADGRVGHDQFSPDRFHDPALIDLVARVRVHRNAALSRRYPAGIPNRLRIRLRDGRALVREVEFPRGHAQNPMSDAEVEDKFRAMARPYLTPVSCDPLLQLIWRFDQLERAADVVGRLTDALAAHGKPGSDS